MTIKFATFAEQQLFWESNPNIQKTYFKALCLKISTFKSRSANALRKVILYGQSLAVKEMVNELNSNLEVEILYPVAVSISSKTATMRELNNISSSIILHYERMYEYLKAIDEEKTEFVSFPYGCFEGKILIKNENEYLYPFPPNRNSNKEWDYHYVDNHRYEIQTNTCYTEKSAIYFPRETGLMGMLIVNA